MKHLYLIAACLILYANTGRAQTTQTSATPVGFSLADCINYAYQHQDSIKNAQLDLKNSEYTIKELIGQGLPQVNGSASFQDYMQIPVSLVPGEFFGQPGTTIPIKFGVKYQSSVGLSLDQKLFDPTYLISLKNRNVYTELFTKNLTRTRIQTNVSVTKAYYQVLVSNEAITLLDANISQLKQQLDQTTAQNKQGFVEKIDVDRLSVSYNNLVTSRENVIRSLALNYELLKFQMGMPIRQNITLTDKLTDIKDANVDYPELANDTSFYKNRIEYSLLQTNEHLNQIDVKRKKAQFLPSVSFFGNASSVYQENTFTNLYGSNFPTSYIGLRLSMPIFTGLQHVYQIKQAQIALQKAQNNLDDAKNSLILQASIARTTYMNGLQSLRSQKLNQDLAREVLRVSKIKYQQGVGSSIEVTQAQTSLEIADNQYIQALYEALISKVDLNKAYGKIN
ncbi:TolC family protein [Mucilaginibacter sp. AW1-3]